MRRFLKSIHVENTDIEKNEQVQRDAEKALQEMEWSDDDDGEEDEGDGELL